MMKRNNKKMKFLRCSLAVCLTVFILLLTMIPVYGEENTSTDATSASESEAEITEEETTDYVENTAESEPEITDSDFTYTVTDGTAVITGYLKTDSQVVIPSRIDGIPVTAISRETFYKNLYITDVVISEGINTIKSGTFFGCENLKSVDLPQSVTKIERYAFSGCSSLEEITIPDGVARIEPWTFSGCTSLLTINIPDGLTQVCCDLRDTAFYNNPDNWENNMLYLGSHLVAVHSDIENVTMRPDTKSITNGTFAKCKGITEIEIAQGIELIPICAFDECTNLQKAIIPEGVITIADSAFQRCISLENVQLSESVTYIGKNAFLECANLYTIYIPENVSFIGDSAFYGCSDVTIYGISGSYAEEYANKNNIRFIDENTLISNDYNGDGMLTVDDVTLLQQTLVMMSDFDRSGRTSSFDFNGDGEFNLIDITLLQLLIA